MPVLPIGRRKGVVQSQANKLVLDNYLNVDGVGRMLLDESLGECWEVQIWRILRVDTNVRCVAAHIR